MNIDRFPDTDLLSITLTAETVRALYMSSGPDEGLPLTISQNEAVHAACAVALDPPPNDQGDPPKDVTE